MTTTNNSIDKSRLFKRAWYLVRTKCYSISYALKTVWNEMKTAIKERIAKLEISETIQYSFSIWTPSAESMQSYYNTSCYKGD